ncbi:MAG: DUF805 domain-containing protein [Hellea sp.]
MIGFIDAVKMFYRRYTDFEGRSSRAEYWWVQLFYIIAFIVLAIPIGLSSGSSGEPNVLAMLPIGIFVLAGILPMIAVQIRRFHDQDKSGWMLLLTLIPYVGGLIVMVFMLLKGTSGPNRFGSDPLGNDADTFS